MKAKVGKLLFHRFKNGKIYALKPWPKRIHVSSYFLDTIWPPFARVDGDVVHFECANGTPAYRIVDKSRAWAWLAERVDA